MRSRLLVLLMSAAGLLCAHVASAQRVRVVQEQTSSGAEHLRFTFDWPQPLQPTLDSLRAAGAQKLVHALAGAGAEGDALVDLPAGYRAQTRVVDARFEDVVLPADAVVDEADRMAYAPDALVRTTPAGTMRGRRVASIAARPFELAGDGRTARRYTEIVVEVSRVRGAPVDRAVMPAAQRVEGVLADGAAFAVTVGADGLYRIDAATITAMGLNPATTDPATVQVFGNGGAPLPELVGAERPQGLLENAVWVRGGGDGRFDAGDEVVFWGAAPQGWRYDDAGWQHYTHPFANANTYFIKAGRGAAKSVSQRPASGTAATAIGEVLGRAVVESDTSNWSREHDGGTIWYSRRIGREDQLRLFSDLALPGFDGGTIDFDIRVAIGSNPRATVVFTSNGAEIGRETARFSVGTSSISPVAYAETVSLSQTRGAGTVDLAMRFAEGTVGNPQAAIDWVRMFYPQQLRATGGLLRFATSAEAGTHGYRLTGFAATPQVWDVTDAGDIHALPVRQEGGAHLVDVDVVAGAPRELVAFTPEAVRSLSSPPVAVAAQNLRAVSGFPDLAIVVPAEFLAEAERLADYRRADGLEVVVATVGQIYNDFSGGVPDMRAVRDYLAFLYHRTQDEEQRLRYALLMGDGHNNFRRLGADKPALRNWIFPYETESALDPVSTYTSDDYFGLLDPDEGVWSWRGRRTESAERVDVGIGRFPAQSVEQARLMIDKIMRYEDPATFGPWRSVYTFVADDGPTGSSGTENDQDLHVQNIESVANLVEDELMPSLRDLKIYGPSYPRVFEGEFRIPGAKRELMEAIREGTLIMNYSGHGGPDALAQEEIFTAEDARTLDNGDRLPVFVTATCSFGWWDLEDEQSGAELLLLNPDGGAVALLTTVRLVFTSQDTTALNVGLNRALNRELFRFGEDGLAPRLGDALRLTKNTPVGLTGNSRKFNLLGDPTMRLGVPAPTVVVERIGDTDLSEAEGRMRALDRVTVSGSVRRFDGSVDDGYDGQVTLTVFDARRDVEMPYARYTDGTYSVREDLLWRGRVRAQGGRFETAFVVPKDISYSDAPGQVIAYAANDVRQAVGETERFVVGGTSDAPPDDQRGPDITLFLNDSTFVAGGLTPADPVLVVQLDDASGVNTVGAGVGHELLLVVDGDEEDAIDLSDRFEAVEGSSTAGTARIQLTDLAPGAHSLRVRAWDVLNNPSEETLSFFVAESNALSLRNVFNYPNPMAARTVFVAEHNQPPGTPAEVVVRVYTLAGRPVRTIAGDEAQPGGVLTGNTVRVPWDGRDADGDRVATGIYLYRVQLVAHADDGERQRAERIEKLAIIR